MKTANTTRHIRKLILAISFKLIFFAAVLFIPIQHLNWPQAWFFLATFSLLVIGSSLYLFIYHPKSLEARFISLNVPNQSKKQKATTLVLIYAILKALLIIPVDVFYLKSGINLPIWLHYLGFFIFLIGYFMILFSMIQNEFAAPVITIQKERLHQLRNKGLYGSIRHPLYSGLVLFFVGLSLFLDSYVAALSGIFFLMMGLVPRILLEEQLLKKELSGYKDYCKQVKYRLIPYLW